MNSIPDVPRSEGERLKKLKNYLEVHLNSKFPYAFPTLYSLMTLSLNLAKDWKFILWE